MEYEEWIQEHNRKKREIVKRLQAKSLLKKEIIDYFDFENMKEKEPLFCPLYLQNKKCHKMENLNCYFCACPNFRINNKKTYINKKLLHSFCSIDSKYGKKSISKESIHQDCSECTIPHTKEYVTKYFEIL